MEEKEDSNDRGTRRAHREARLHGGDEHEIFERAVVRNSKEPPQRLSWSGTTRPRGCRKDARGNEESRSAQTTLLNRRGECAEQCVESNNGFRTSENGIGGAQLMPSDIRSSAKYHSVFSSDLDLGILELE